MICLQTATEFWLGGVTISLSCSMGLMMLGRQIHTEEALVPELSAVEVDMAVGKLKSHKSPGTDEIPAELIKALGRAVRSEIHKLINCVWNWEELPEECKELIIVPIYTKGNKTDCSNYRGISLLPTTYKILYNIMLSRLTPYAEEILGTISVDFDAAV